MEFYVSSSRNSGGYLPNCKECTAKYQKARYKAEYHKAYREENKVEIKRKRKIYRETHKAELKAYADDHKAEARAYREAHKAEISIRGKAYHKAHVEQRKITSKLYREAHKDEIKDKDRRNRALKRGANHEAYMGRYIFERDNWICGICGRKINKRLKYPNPLSVSIDHIVPLSKGGDDSPVNVQAAHFRCNLGKNARNVGQLRMFG